MRLRDRYVEGQRVVELLPNSGHHQFEPGDDTTSLHRSWVVENFGLVAGAVDGDNLAIGIDEPRYLGAVCDPQIHLGFKVREAVGRRTKFNDEIRTDG